MKTGTDMSIAICRSEGYPVVEHGRGPLDVGKDYRLTISFPPAWDAHGRFRVGGGYPAYLVDSPTSYAELWRLFEAQGQPIKDFCDFGNCPLPPPDGAPTFSDYVHLAGCLYGYGGDGYFN